MRHVVFSFEKVPQENIPIVFVNITVISSQKIFFGVDASYAFLLYLLLLTLTIPTIFQPFTPVVTACHCWRAFCQIFIIKYNTHYATLVTPVDLLLDKRHSQITVTLAIKF